MNDPEAAVRDALAAFPLDSTLIACDPEKADTAVFCSYYGYSAEDSANTILVSAKTGQKRTVACVLLADSRLDVNHVVRKRLQSRRVSFTSADKTRQLTGMEIGGVTPISLPEDMAIWVDGRVMSRPQIVLGGGSRSIKVVVAPQVFEYIPNVEIIDELAKVNEYE